MTLLYRLVSLFLPMLVGDAVKPPALYRLTEPIEHGEGPTWEPRKNLLYYVDIHAGNIHTFDPKSGDVHSMHLDGDVSPVIPTGMDPDLLVVGVNRSLMIVEWDGKDRKGNSRVLTTVSEEFPDSRFNDGKADRQGRIWIGTMGYENSTTFLRQQGALYKISRANMSNPEIVIAPVDISNGMAWNRDDDRLFYIDTPTRQVVQYDFDNDKGQLGKKRVVFDMRDHPELGGFPDGMTIDREDKLWIALYNGGSIIRVDPINSRLLQQIAIPAKAVTSVTWGGPKLDILYVTTSRRDLKPDQRKELPSAGCLFAVEGLEVGGFAPYEADIF